MTPVQFPARFMDKVASDPVTGCWLWTAADNGVGYGVFSWEGRQGYAHRFAWAQANGPIPADPRRPGKSLVLDHFKFPEACAGPSCVNPDHLRPVTHRENLLRGDTITSRAAAATQCPAGHEYNTANTYVAPNGDRKCRACCRARFGPWGECVRRVGDRWQARARLGGRHLGMFDTEAEARSAAGAAQTRGSA